MTRKIILGVITGAVLLGTTLTMTLDNNNAEAKQLPNAVCPPEFVQHGDKVMVKILSGNSLTSTGLPVLNQVDVIDIKFKESPSDVATLTDLKDKVFERMSDELGYDEIGSGNEFDLSDFEVIDVEYAIICAATADPPIVR